MRAYLRGLQSQRMYNSCVVECEHMALNSDESKDRRVTCTLMSGKQIRVSPTYVRKIRPPPRFPRGCVHERFVARICKSRLPAEELVERIMGYLKLENVHMGEVRALSCSSNMDDGDADHSMHGTLTRKVASTPTLLCSPFL